MQFKAEDDKVKCQVLDLPVLKPETKYPNEFKIKGIGAYCPQTNV